MVENFVNQEYNGRYYSSNFEDFDEKIFQDLENNEATNTISKFDQWPVFVKNDKCIWWHEDRQWWMGPCENLGKIFGYTYLCV